MMRKAVPRTTERHGLRLFVLLLVGWLLVPWSAAGAASGSDLLEKKMNQIIDLQKKLSGKISRAENILRQLDEQLEGLAVEIQDERLRAGVLSYRDAIRLQSLDNRLKLARQLLSYIGQIRKKVATFKDGRRQLSFLYQEATDDLKIIQTLSHFRLDDFIARTDRLLAYLKSELVQPLARADAIRYEHTAATWEAVITRN